MAKTLDDQVREIEAWAARIDEVLKIFYEPDLAPEHPDAANQRRGKADAQAELTVIEERLPELVRLALKKAQEILDLPDLPADDPNATARQESKRNVRIQMLLWDAHYGPGGPLEQFKPPIEGDKDGQA